MPKINIEEILQKAREYHKHHWLEEAERLYRIILSEVPEHPDVNHSLGDLAMRVNKPEVAILFFEKALKINPESSEFEHSLANAKAKLNAISVSNENREDRNIFELVGNDFIFERKIESLERKLSLLNDKLNNMHEALNYLDIFQMTDFDSPSSKMLPIELIDKRSTKTLIAFGGMASGLSMPPKEFFNSLADKDINIIFVKDFEQCWYQTGFLGKTKGISSSILYLQNIIPDNTKELITLGASSGGYAAIRFGIGLNAGRIMAFSPQTLIDEETVRVFSKDCVKKLNFGSDDLDLRKVLDQNQEVYNIEVYYGRLNNRDRVNVNHIKDYIKEFSYDTDEHLLASFLKEKGMLKEILESI